MKTNLQSSVFCLNPKIKILLLLVRERMKELRWEINRLQRIKRTTTKGRRNLKEKLERRCLDYLDLEIEEHFLMWGGKNVGASSWVHLDVKLIVRETDNAFLLDIIGQMEEIWIPKSQISDADNYKQGDKNCTISVTEWIANNKGLNNDT